MKHLSQICLYVTILILSACKGGNPVENQESSTLVNAPKHVIVVGFDGFSAASINTGGVLPEMKHMPTLRNLMANGSYTLQNRSVLPSSSAVNWASMWMGAGPELHGYTTWGSQTPDLPSRVLTGNGIFPDVFAMVRKTHPAAEIGYIYEWGGMRYLADTLSISYVQQAPLSGENIEESTALAVNYIKEKKPNLCAVIFAEPDGTGHGIGWGTPEYIQKLTQLDQALATIVKAVEDANMMDETVIIVTSDHGGIDTGHGGITMNEMQTPVVFYGKGIKKGFVIPESTMVFDIAGTIGYLFSIKQPQVWIARPITSIFANISAS